MFVFLSKKLKNLEEKVVKNRYRKAAVIKKVKGECSTFDAIRVCLIISTNPVTEIKDVSFRVDLEELTNMPLLKLHLNMLQR